MDSEVKIAGLKATVAILLVIPALALKGWVLKITWSWFAVPVFGLPPLRVAYAVGLAAVVALLTGSAYRKPAEEDYSKLVLGAFLTPLFYLLLCWVVKLFI